MAIKFIPDDQNVVLAGQDEFETRISVLLRCLINQSNKIELQLEKLTGEEIDSDDGDIV